MGDGEGSDLEMHGREDSNQNASVAGDKHYACWGGASSWEGACAGSWARSCLMSKVCRIILRLLRFLRKRGPCFSLGDRWLRNNVHEKILSTKAKHVSFRLFYRQQQPSPLLGHCGMLIDLGEAVSCCL